MLWGFASVKSLTFFLKLQTLLVLAVEILQAQIIILLNEPVANLS